MTLFNPLSIGFLSGQAEKYLSAVMKGLLTVCQAASLDMSHGPPHPPLCPSASTTHRLLSSIIFILSFSFSIVCGELMLRFKLADAVTQKAYGLMIK